MKKLRYTILQNTLEDGTVITAEKVMEYSENAKAEALGAYEVFQDDEMEAEPTPSHRLAVLEEALEMILSGVTE